MKYLFSCVGLLCTALFFNLGWSQVSTYSYTGTIETYTVPPGVTSIEIETRGAQGGYDDGGLGAIMVGTFAVTPGQVLEILVGNEGAENASTSNQGGAGGGGTFVVDQATGDPLIISGGGGGGCEPGSLSSYTAPYDAAITNAQLGEDGATTTGGAGGGTGGNGGAAGFTDCCLTGTLGGSGGGGFYTDGEDGSPGDAAGIPSEGGAAYVNGGAGGVCGVANASYPAPTGTGGFGGGGGSAMDNAFRAGGGGGYSGGQGAAYISGGSGYIWGGGGGSYNVGTDQDNSIGNTGDGMVTITELCNGLVITVSSDSVCDGEEVTLSASSTGGGTVTWDGGVVNGEAFTPSAGTTTYTATSDDPDDCGFAIDIVVFELPTVDAGMDQNVCEGDSTMLSGTGTATDWSWDGGITNGVNFMPPSGTTTYTLTGTIDSTGCTAEDMVDVTVITIDVSITAGGGSLTANQAGATYQWLNCPDYSVISGETNQVYSAVPDGDYAVEVTLDGCVDTSACQIVHVGFDENESPLAELYPNPTNGQVQLTVDGQFNYVLMNVLGETIFAGTGANTATIDLTTQAKGAYFLKVIADGSEQTIKVIRQ